MFSAATMTVITSEITHKEFRQFCTVASLKLDLNVTLGKENRGEPWLARRRINSGRLKSRPYKIIRTWGWGYM